jgi:hypothetical protein
MKKLFSRSLLLFLVLTLSIASVPSSSLSALAGGEWRAGRIIDDAIFTNAGDMSVAQIQDFLNRTVGTGSSSGSTAGRCDTNGTSQSELGGGTRAQYGAANSNPAPFTCLKDYYEVPKLAPSPEAPVTNYGSATIPVGAKSAAQLIWDAAQRYSINPKVLLVKLHTESAGPLTKDDWPFLRQYTYAMGAHCPDSGPGGSANCDPNYAGFSIQISEAAALLRYYLDNMGQSWWPYKKPMQNNTILWNVEPRGCGASTVYIETSATAALYTYTPYQPNKAALDNLYGTGDNCSAYGNRNFWRVYNDLFGSPIGCPTVQEGIVYRLLQQSNNNYFYSANSAEMCWAVKYYGYLIEGPAFQTLSASDTDARSVYRLSRNSNYLYTSDYNEVLAAMNSYGYRYEGVELYGKATTGPGYYPVYRLSKNSQYVMTMSDVERDSFIASGYSYEGIFFYAKSPSTRIPVYRLSKNGIHFYTTSNGERTAAISAHGYNDEGIGFYAQSGMTGDTTLAYRLERSGQRLYTASYNEKQIALASKYKQESDAFYVYGANYPGTTPVFRLVNKATGDYLFTTFEYERDAAVSLYGYTYQGVGFNSSP